MRSQILGVVAFPLPVALPTRHSGRNGEWPVGGGLPRESVWDRCRKGQFIKRHSTLGYLLTAVVSIGIAPTSWAASYYVDPASGSDASIGTEAAPWRTLAKVNGASLRGGDTVHFRRGGLWNELLKPASGTNGSLVTYDAYGTGNKPSIRGLYADGKSYIRLQNLEFKNGSTDTPALLYNGSHHISLQNCTIIAGSSCTSYVALWLSTNVSYNAVVGCDIRHDNTSRIVDAVNLRLNANYNIFRDNRIDGGTHYALAVEGSLMDGYTCNYNVFSGNLIQSKAGGISISQDSDRNVIENNTIAGGTNYGFSNGAVRSFKLVSRHNIVRGNIVRDNLDPASSGISIEVYASTGYPPNVATGNHVYNNIITNIAQFPLVFSTNGTPGTAAYDNHYKNNLIYNNSFTYQHWIMDHPTIHDNFFNNNLFFKAGVNNILNIRGTYTNVAGIQASDPTHFWGNLQVDPLLDAAFHPLPGSPCIDAGDFLTRVTSARGSGTTFAVADAGYFTDGFGVASGDQIGVGSATATIVGIDYMNDTITVDGSIAWTSGDPVSLRFGGTQPDLGVFEYGAGPATEVLMPPTNLTVQ